MAKKSSKRAVVIASSKEASRFIQAFQAFLKTFPGQRGSTASRKAMREYLAQFDDETQRGVLRRALINLIQHPTAPTGPIRGSENSDRQRPRRSARTRR